MPGAIVVSDPEPSGELSEADLGFLTAACQWSMVAQALSLRDALAGASHAHTRTSLYKILRPSVPTTLFIPTEMFIPHFVGVAASSD